MREAACAGSPFVAWKRSVDEGDAWGEAKAGIGHEDFLFYTGLKLVCEPHNAAAAP